MVTQILEPSKLWIYRWKEDAEMMERYGKGTHAPCVECGRKIFITEAEVTTVRGGKRLVELMCKSPGCVAYDRPRLYDEDTLEIHGAAAAG